MQAKCIRRATLLARGLPQFCWGAAIIMMLPLRKGSGASRLRPRPVASMSGCHGTRTQSLGKNLPPQRHSNEKRPSVEGAVRPGLGAAPDWRLSSRSSSRLFWSPARNGSGGFLASPISALYPSSSWSAARPPMTRLAVLRISARRALTLRRGSIRSPLTNCGLCSRR
jgi:hypothetical protein